MSASGTFEKHDFDTFILSGHHVDDATVQD